MDDSLLTIICNLSKGQKIEVQAADGSWAPIMAGPNELIVLPGEIDFSQLLLSSTDRVHKLR